MTILTKDLITKIYPHGDDAVSNGVRQQTSNRDDIPHIARSSFVLLPICSPKRAASNFEV